MSGKKGMKHYCEAEKDEARRRWKAGESLRSISRDMGVSKYSVQGVLYLSMIRDLFDQSIVAYKTATRQTVNAWKWKRLIKQCR